MSMSGPQRHICIQYGPCAFVNSTNGNVEHAPTLQLVIRRRSDFLVCCT